MDLPLPTDLLHIVIDILNLQNYMVHFKRVFQDELITENTGHSRSTQMLSRFNNIFSRKNEMLCLKKLFLIQLKMI